MKRFIFAVMFLLCFTSCHKLLMIEPVGFEVNIEVDSVLFAELSDYGCGGTAEGLVADMIRSWNPDFIVTAGDNNYPEGKYNTIREHIGQYYCDFIYNYDAHTEYQCRGKAWERGVNQFFPIPGNHDANNSLGLLPYYNYFTLPGNEVYYKFTWGPVTFFCLNCYDRGINEQRDWLEEGTAHSTTPFNIVVLHEPPYSCAAHGNHEQWQWDYHGMGIDLVLSGHDHAYNRIEKKDESGLYYIVNGLGGRDAAGCGAFPLPEDQFISYCYDANYGAMRIQVNQRRLLMEFVSVGPPEEVIDHLLIEK
jgi:tartrate-resistant acid phosphatase type 5